MDVPQGKQTVSDEEIIEAMEDGPGPAYVTKEVAEMVGMTREGVRGRLEDLAARGEICVKKPTERTVIWWTHSDESEPILSK